MNDIRQRAARLRFELVRTHSPLIRAKVEIPRDSRQWHLYRPACLLCLARPPS
jgi:hypothetical protein